MPRLLSSSEIEERGGQVHTDDALYVTPKGAIVLRAFLYGADTELLKRNGEIIPRQIVVVTPDDKRLDVRFESNGQLIYRNAERRQGHYKDQKSWYESMGVKFPGPAPR